MGWFSKKPKCIFCEAKKGLFHSVHAYGIYGQIGNRLYYHPECLDMVESNPERHGHRMVDKALHIVELKKQNITNTNQYIVEKYEEKIEKIHRNSFERMMPKRS